MVKNIIFDFDGVILDSMNIRLCGFREVFKEHGEENFNQFIPYHLENGGISRFVKIRHFFEQILHKDISEEEVNSIAKKFGDIMKEMLIDNRYLISDTVSFIAKNYKNYNMHIASGAEESELIFLCQKHKIDTFFHSIKGSPTKKETVIKNILEENYYEIKESVMVGDSFRDYEAAAINKIEFYGYNNEKLVDVSKEYIKKFETFSF